MDNRPFTADRGGERKRNSQNQNMNKQQAQAQYDQQANMEYNQQQDDMMFQQYNQQQFNGQRSGSAKVFKINKPNSAANRDNYMGKQQNVQGYRAQTAQQRPNPYQGGNKYQAPLQAKADFFKKNQETFDKEQLFEDLQHAKGIINQLREENAHLKTKNLNFEREINKQQKLIEEIQHQAQTGKRNNKFGNDAFLVTSLKRNVKELQQEVQYKNQEIDKLKKNIKYTKFSEIEIEKKAFADETIRLRRITEQLLEENRNIENQEDKCKQLEERCFLLNNLVDTLRKDNSDMANVIRVLEEKTYNDQQQVLAKNKQLQDQKKLINTQKKQLADKDEQLKSLRKNHALIGQQKSGQKGGGIKDKDNASQLYDQIFDKDQKIQDLEMQIKQYETQQQQYQFQQNQSQQSQQQKVKSPQKQQNQQQQQKSPQKEEEAAPKVVKPRVKVEDLEYYFDYIKIVLQLSDFDMNDLSEHMKHNLPQECIANNEANFNQLRDYLQNQPFQLEDDEELENFIRFLIEPQNGEEFITFEPEKQCNLSIIKSQISKYIEYKLLSNDEKNQSFEYIQYLLKSKMEVIRQTLEQESGNKDLFSYKNIEPAFTNAQITLQKDQINYILVKILNFSDQRSDKDCLKNLKLTDLFAAFSVSLEKPSRAKRPASSKGRRTSEQKSQQASVNNNQKPVKKQTSDDEYEDLMEDEDDSEENKNNNNQKQVSFKNPQQQQKQQNPDYYGEEEEEFYNDNEESHDKDPIKAKQDEYGDDDFEQDTNEAKTIKKTQKQDEYGDDFEQEKFTSTNEQKQPKKDEYGDDFEKEKTTTKNKDSYGDDFENEDQQDKQKKKNEYDEDYDNFKDDNDVQIPEKQGKFDLSRDLVDDKVDLSDGQQEI